MLLLLTLKFLNKRDLKNQKFKNIYEKPCRPTFELEIVI